MCSNLNLCWAYQRYDEVDCETCHKKVCDLKCDINIENSLQIENLVV